MPIYQPFTYLIKFIPTGQVYYGVRTKRGCHPAELWTTYFTSSKTVHNLIEEHGLDAFEVTIRQTFETKEQAILWEHRVLTKFDSAKNKQWLNKNNGDRKFYGSKTMTGKKHTEDAKRRMSINSSGEKNPMFGVKRSAESRRKMSESSTGKKHTADTKKKLSILKSGVNNPNYGKKYHWYNNGTNAIQIVIGEQVPAGFVRGRIWKEDHRAKMESARWPK